MTNGEHGGNLMREILRGIAREYGWPNYQPVERVPVTINPAVLAAYVGQYEINQANAQGIVTISSANQKLYLQAPPSAPQKLELYPLADDRFFMLDENAEICFVKDVRGKVTALRAKTLDEDVMAERIP
jgi:hypothetical protein